ncbi:MAG TPA: alpha/beta hydrolase [Gemmataceae bacterium]|jgi:pimeloyl-ACP methyl ester carboxylesterase
MFRCLKLTLLCSLFLIAGIGRADEGYFDSGGVQIHYLVEGRGEAVVLIHGFVVDAYIQWALPGVMRSLAKDHLVIALDVRGHGKSGKPTETEKYGTEMVEDVVRLLDHLEIKKAHVVGYSMGALITGKLLATHPDRLLSATLGGCGVFPEGVRQPEYLEKLAQSLEEGKGLAPLMKALSPSGKSNPPAMVNTVVNRLVRENGKAFAAVVRSWKDLGVSKEKLRSNKVPTLALIGSKDPLKEAVDYMKDEMENLEVIVIDGANHLSTYTNAKFIRSLRKFLADNSQNKKEKKATSKNAE